MKSAKNAPSNSRNFAIPEAVYREHKASLDAHCLNGNVPAGVNLVVPVSHAVNKGGAQRTHFAIPSKKYHYVRINGAGFQASNAITVDILAPYANFRSFINTKSRLQKIFARPTRDALDIIVADLRADPKAEKLKRDDHLKNTLIHVSLTLEIDPIETFGINALYLRNQIFNIHNHLRFRFNFQGAKANTHVEWSSTTGNFRYIADAADAGVMCPYIADDAWASLTKVARHEFDSFDEFAEQLVATDTACRKMYSHSFSKLVSMDGVGWMDVFELPPNGIKNRQQPAADAVFAELETLVMELKLADLGHVVSTEMARCLEKSILNSRIGNPTAQTQTQLNWTSNNATAQSAPTKTFKI